VQFSSFSDFLMMDGHALYVWLSYGIAITIVIVNVALPILSRKTLVNNLARRIRRESKQQ